jgi:hypothetical protein
MTSRTNIFLYNVTSCHRIDMINKYVDLIVYESSILKLRSLVNTLHKLFKELLTLLLLFLRRILSGHIDIRLQETMGLVLYQILSLRVDKAQEIIDINHKQKFIQSNF